MDKVIKCEESGDSQYPCSCSYGGALESNMILEASCMYSSVGTKEVSV